MRATLVMIACAGGVMGGSGFLSAVPAAVLLARATATSARALSDRSPILAGQWIPRGAALIVLVVLMVIGAPMKAQPQRTDDPGALNKHISDLYSAGKFGEAIPLAEKSLELTRTQRGPDHLDTAARMV